MKFRRLWNEFVLDSSWFRRLLSALVYISEKSSQTWDTLVYNSRRLSYHEPKNNLQMYLAAMVLPGLYARIWRWHSKLPLTSEEISFMSQQLSQLPDTRRKRVQEVAPDFFCRNRQEWRPNGSCGAGCEIYVLGGCSGRRSLTTNPGVPL